MNYPKITDQFNEIGKDFKNSIPHIVIGKNQETKPIQQQEKELAKIESEKERYEFFEKIRFWGMIIAILLVFAYASYNLVKIFMS